MTPFAKNKPVTLDQRGRSGLEILGSMQKFTSAYVRGKAKAAFEADPEGAAIVRGWNDRHNEPWAERIAKARDVAERSAAYGAERLLQRYVAEEVYVRGIPATERRRKEAEAFIQSPIEKPAGGTLELDPNVKYPNWYDIEWHLMPGGWDGYDLIGATMSSGIAPLVFRHGGYAAVESGDDILQQRIDVAKQFPKKSYGRIYEPGCGGVGTLMAVKKVFPECEVVGSDLSTRLLKNAHAAAERMGFKITLKQRDARDTREPDASFDGVIMYALQHEMPVDVNVDSFKEAFRILKPGGDIVLSDPPPFSAVHPFQAVVLDWDTDNRGEPFFSEILSQDWPQTLRDIGFVNVEAYTVGKQGYPWVIRGSKPL